MNIYLVGNTLVDVDAMPFKLEPNLQKKFPKIHFLEFDPTEEFPDDKKLIFIDSVINLDEPKLFTSITQFEPIVTNQLTVHNFDFYTELVLRKKIGLCKKYFIIGIPANNNLSQLTKDITRIINQLLFHFTFKK